MWEKALVISNQDLAKIRRSPAPFAAPFRLQRDVKGELLIAMDLDKSKPVRWWNIVAFAGGLIAVAAGLEQFIAAVLIGLGLLSFGVGEWINHPKRIQMARSKIVNIDTKVGQDIPGSPEPTAY